MTKTHTYKGISYREVDRKAIVGDLITYSYKGKSEETPREVLEVLDETADFESYFDDNGVETSGYAHYAYLVLEETYEKESDKMTNKLTEMPKVGDKIRFIGDPIDWLIVGKVYEVTETMGESFYVADEWGGDTGSDLSERDDWELVSKAQPDVYDLIANLGRRLHEVEQYLADEEAEQYPDDEEVPEEAPEPIIRDAVNSPNHYTSGPVEVIDYIDQVADGYEGKQAAYVANVIKYVSRAPYKNKSQDIRKAIWYAERLAGAMEREESEAGE